VRVNAHAQSENACASAHTRGWQTPIRSTIRKRRTEHERLEASGRRLLGLRADGARVSIPDIVISPLWVQELVVSPGVMEQGFRAVLREEVIPLGPLLAPEHVVVDTLVEAGKVNGNRRHAALR